MSQLFEELDFRPTPMGALSLRRRHDLVLGKDVYEIKLGGAFLMSSQFTASETALGHLGVSEIARPEPFDIVVGGLGLGHTAKAVLENASVGSLIVIDIMEAVIDWHTSDLVPLGSELTADPRCRLVHADFFEKAASAQGFDPTEPGRTFDAVLLDIDHAPDFLLDRKHASTYTPAGLRRLAAHIKHGSSFGLWSDAPANRAFTQSLGKVFGSARAETVRFHNPYLGSEASQTVYLARKRDE